jgi:protein CpxP
MKKVIFLLALIVSVGTLYAQTKNKGKGNRTYANLDERVNEVTGKLKTDLKLTDDQASQVRAITLNRVKQVSDAKKSFGEDKKGFNQARKTIFQGWETELKSIVTADQYAAYLVKKDERKKSPKPDEDPEEIITTQ